MKLHAEFKQDSIEDFLYILKGLKEFTSFAIENSFLCFKFSEKYLYIFGNEKKHVEIFIKITMNDLFYENFILKSNSNNEIIILVYIFQIYDIFKNITNKNTKITIDLFEKNGICILLFKNYCNVTDAFKKYECGIEIINPTLTNFPNIKMNKHFLCVNCKLKKCCKILNTYSKFFSDKIQITFQVSNKNCDIIFLMNSLTSQNITTLKNNFVLKNIVDKKKQNNLHNIQDIKNLQYKRKGNNIQYNTQIIKKVIFIKTLMKALNILNECRNNKEDVGIFKIMVPYNKCWFGLKLGQFESSGNWKIVIIITDLNTDE